MAEADEDRITRRDGPDHVAVLTLNRPDKLNAFDDVMLERFTERLRECEADEDVRVIVVRGEGRCFSVGADASGSGRSESTPEDWRVMLLERGWGRFLDLWESPKVVVAEVHGFCMGIATLLCNCADIVVVADDARVGWPALPFGGGILGPAMVWHIGIHKAKELSFQIGSSMTGEEAERFGFANRCVPRAELGAAVESLAADIARFPPDLLRLKKEAINQVAETMGFSRAMRAGATWGALAHHSRGAEEAKAVVRELGLKGAIAHYRGEAPPTPDP
ncbi:MAG: enoyl-CoA hydratase/isomerase family protein [Acidimicrobiia bacterium]